MFLYFNPESVYFVSISQLFLVDFVLHLSARDISDILVHALIHFLQTHWDFVDAIMFFFALLLAFLLVSCWFVLLV